HWSPGAAISSHATTSREACIRPCPSAAIASSNANPCSITDRAGGACSPTEAVEGRIRRILVVNHQRFALVNLELVVLLAFVRETRTNRCRGRVSNHERR